MYFWALNLVFICPTLCHMKTTCLLLMKQKLYALDAFFIEKLKLSENYPAALFSVTGFLSWWESRKCIYHCPTCFAVNYLLCKGHAYVCTRITHELVILKQNKPNVSKTKQNLIEIYFLNISLIFFKSYFMRNMSDIDHCPITIGWT